MRLPRHDTSLSLPAEAPAAAITADEALLETLGSRFWTAANPAVVVGIGLSHRLPSIVDLDRCRAAGIDVLARRAGGGALLLAPDSMLCGAVAVPTASIPSDVTRSYRWLAEALVEVLHDLDIPARVVDVGEARRNVADLRQSNPALLNTCYGGLSPYEIVVGDKKLVGLAQIRRRHSALFQFGILLEDQSRLAELLVAPDEAARADVETQLRSRTVGLSQLSARSASEVAAAIAGAMPCVP